MKILSSFLFALALASSGSLLAGDIPSAKDLVDSGPSAKYAVSGKSSPKGIVDPPPPAEPCFTYSFVDVGYIYRDNDPHWGEEGHGAGANLSYAIAGPLYVTASYEYVDTEANVDYALYDATQQDASAGIGAYYEVAECIHITVEGGAVWTETDVDYYGAQDDWGYYVGPGIRAKFVKGVEIFGNAYYSDFDEFDGWSYNTGLVIDITGNLALKFAGVFNEDAESYFAGLRLNF